MVTTTRVEDIGLVDDYFITLDPTQLLVVGLGKIPAARTHLIPLVVGRFDADAMIFSVQDRVRRNLVGDQSTGELGT